MGSKKSTFNANFLLRKHKMLKNGEAPICMRITVNNQAVDISIKRSVDVDYWNQTRECCTSTGKVGKELNRYIDTMRAKVLQAHRELELDNIRVTADAIRNKLYRRDESQKTLIEVYAEHNKRCRALIGKDFSISTVEKFDTSLNTLKEFIKHTTKRGDILLKEVNRVFIQDFEFPEGTSVYGYLRDFFVESYSTQKIFVLFVTSENTKKSWGAITEVGASWITQIDHKIFNIPPFRPEHPLDDESLWHCTNREDSSPIELFMSPLNADIFCQKIETVCDQLGYKKKSRVENKDYLGKLIPMK